MKNLNIISPDSIITGNYLGQGIDLGGQQIDFLVSQGFSNTKKSHLGSRQFSHRFENTYFSTRHRLPATGKPQYRIDLFVACQQIQRRAR